MKINKGRRSVPRRVLFYGVSGVGKSSWAAKAPSPIFLNVEDGLADIECDSTEQLRSFSDVIDAINWLITNPHSYKTAVLDSLDWVEKLIHKDIAQAAGKESIGDIDFAKGYERAEPKWRMLLDFLEGLRRSKNMAVILLAHSRVQPFIHPELGAYDRYVPDLYLNKKGEGPANTIREWCDEVLFASYKTYTTKDSKTSPQRATGGTERYVRTIESPTCIAKNRLGMPDEIPMEFEAYASYVKANQPAPAPAGNVAGLVVDGSSKPREMDAELLAEAAATF